MTAVHQFVPALVARDAIGAHTLQVQRVLRELGYASDLFVDHTDLTGRADVHPYRQFDEHSRDPDTFLLYQGSTGSPMARFLAERSEPTIVNYHNITPPEFFEPWEPSVTMVLEAGYRQIEELGPRHGPRDRRLRVQRGRAPPPRLRRDRGRPDPLRPRQPTTPRPIPRRCTAWRPRRRAAAATGCSSGGCARTRRSTTW